MGSRARNSLSGALVLGSDPTSGEDGLLQVPEIRDLSLNADLVTLSACDTGVGALEGEEGVTNLVRAFLFAGAKSLVASLWTADDPSTLTLMERFYRYIAQGEDKGSALRHAQLDLIGEAGEQALPLYWGGCRMSQWNHPRRKRDLTGAVAHHDETRPVVRPSRGTLC